MGLTATIEDIKVADTESGTLSIVNLGVPERDQILPIFIGVDEGARIVKGLDFPNTSNSKTHDLLLDVVEALGSRIHRVKITDFHNGTYSAELIIKTPRTEEGIIASPGDALALAVRSNIPIEIDSSLFDAQSEPSVTFTELDDIRDVIV